MRTSRSSSSPRFRTSTAPWPRTRGGAFEYLPKPFDIDETVELVAKAATPERRRTDAGGAAPGAPDGRAGTGHAGGFPRHRPVVALQHDGAHHRRNGHRQGSWWRGALHRNSPRAKKPFVALNTSAITPELLESELFGHERGAFTGADKRRLGRFEQADGGTLFLDEIGDMSVALQTRLLRVLAENEFFRVGGQTPVRVDVRVIAATHQDLDAAVQEERFREDLYHRLNVVQVADSAASRPQGRDIPELARVWLEQAAGEIGIAPQAAERGCACGDDGLGLAGQRARTGESLPAADGQLRPGRRSAWRISPPSPALPHPGRGRATGRRPWRPGPKAESRRRPTSRCWPRPCRSSNAPSYGPRCDRPGGGAWRPPGCWVGDATP